MPTQAQSDELRKFIGIYERQYAKRGSIPWIRRDVALAQFVLETGWGSSNLYRNYNNAYGMRPSSRGIHDGVVNTANGAFATYANVDRSVDDYIERLVKFNYDNKGQFSNAKDLDGYLAALNPKAGLAYTTEPGYNSAIKQIINSTPMINGSGFPPGGGGESTVELPPSNAPWWVTLIVYVTIALSVFAVIRWALRKFWPNLYARG